jgi:hypothetical protein
MMRISKGNNMRRTNRNITRTKSWTNKKSSRSMSMNSSYLIRKRSQGIHQKGEISCWAHECSCYEKSYDHQMSQLVRKATNQNPTKIKHTKSMGVRLENHLATLVMYRKQSESINHMFPRPPSITYIGREKGRWLRAGVSEINLRNLALNHTTRGSIHNLLHFTIGLSGT